MPHIGIEGQSFADRSAHQKWNPSHETLRPPGKMHKRLRACFRYLRTRGWIVAALIALVAAIAAGIPQTH